MFFKKYAKFYIKTKIIFFMKVIIPIAGTGSRLKPHTFTTPKSQMEVAGKPIIDYVMDDVKKLNPDEIIFIVGYKRKTVKDYILENYPNLNCKFVYQKVRDGDGSAIRLGLADIEKDDDLYVIFGADTLIDFDIKKAISKYKDQDATVFAMRVPNPSSYGVVNHNEDMTITGVEEKPEVPKSDLAIIGAYYFKSAFKVKKYLEHFYENDIREVGEFKLIQVIREYLENSNLNLKVYEVKQWFDCGRVEVLLKANQYFLGKSSKGKIVTKNNSIIIAPCFIHKNAQIKNSIIGPNVSLGDNSNIENSIIKNSIINSDSKLNNVNLENSIIGKEAILEDKAKKLNLGDKSEFYLN